MNTHPRQPKEQVVSRGIRCDEALERIIVVREVQ